MAKSWPRVSIAVKATALVAALIVGFGAVLIGLNFAAERTFAFAAAQRTLESNAEALANKTAAAFEARDVTTVQAQLRAAALEKGYGHVGAIDRHGRTIVGRGPVGRLSGDVTALRVLDTKSLICLPENGRLRAAQPVFYDGALVGVVTLEAGLAEIQARAWTLMWRNAALVGLTLAVALPLTLMVIRRAMRPIQALTNAATKLAGRDFDVDLDVRTGDEFEVLADAFIDMTGQVKSGMERVRRLAFVDELTQLPNKTAFMEHLRRAMTSADTPGAVLLVNLDRFKRFNDTFGAREGDRILSAAAERLQAVLRQLRSRYLHPDAKAPVAARIGGDEFAILICGPAPTGVAKHTARDLVKAIAAPLELAGQQISLTARVGIARFPLDAPDADHLLRHANLALDAAKSDGGGSFRFFEPDMTRRAVERMTLETELRQAVARDEFVVHYQPKIDARTGACTGCEALVRWNRRGRIVGPGAFIEAAEESGLIIEIGQIVLHKACAAARRWLNEGLDAHVAVNVSAVQFERDDFNKVVLGALTEAGLDPKYLELELTESVAMHELERVIDQVEPLRAQGVRFAIDDFGTGYSSLSSLTRLPFDVFKIDQSFVRRLEEDPDARVVIETILAMARALGYDTVAEGVETPSQFAFLRLNGCTNAQGWHFGKPMPEHEFVDFLRQDARGAVANVTGEAPTLDESRSDDPGADVAGDDVEAPEPPAAAAG